MKHPNDLNETQQIVVTSGQGPHLILAGAGTGKTKTLVHRLSYLVESGMDPKSILLLTFSRRAAREMLFRATNLLDSRVRSVTGGTFHSFCLHFLRRFGLSQGIPPNFTIMDENETTDCIGLVRDQFWSKTTEKRFPKKETLAEIFSTSFNQQISLEKAITKEYPSFLTFTKDIQSLRTSFQEYKLKYNLLDFDDLLHFTKTILVENEPIRKNISNTYKSILVDEYQDTNRIQAHIACLLASIHENILVVGDDAQCIYGFRGASVHNILDFPKIFPNTKTITLTKNYRSTQNILNLANGVLEQSSINFKKKLQSVKEDQGKLPSLLLTETLHDEANLIANQILELHEDGVKFSEIAILFRASYQSNVLEINLAAKNIPYRKFGGRKFLELSHTKDILAYFRVLNNPRDVLAWNRILLLEKHIGKKYTKLLLQSLESIDFNIFSENEKELWFGLPTDISHSLQNLVLFLQTTAKEKLSTVLTFEQILKHYIPILETVYDDYEKRKNDLETLKILSNEFKDLEDFLANLTLDPKDSLDPDLVKDQDNEDSLTLSTVHSSKGLEWKHVFVLQVNEGSFPNSRIRLTEELEEERRLFYVAITRAAFHLYLSYPIVGDKNKMSPLSRFLSDLQKEPPLFESITSTSADRNLDKNSQNNEVDSHRFTEIQNYFLN
ncbi:ATP-dependent helicase [Leptospira sp. 96542]|nr:ATP-dependent helicase [Leptospira sp. 96542]